MLSRAYARCAALGGCQRKESCARYISKEDAEKYQAQAPGALLTFADFTGIYPDGVGCIYIMKLGTVAARQLAEQNG